MKCVECDEYMICGRGNDLRKKRHRCQKARDVKTQTNYDRIISKTPEELATLIADNIDCNICKEIHDPKYERCPGAISEEKGCSAIWLDWLGKEADE